VGPAISGEARGKAREPALGNEGDEEKRLPWRVLGEEAAGRGKASGGGEEEEGTEKPDEGLGTLYGVGNRIGASWRRSLETANAGVLRICGPDADCPPSPLRTTPPGGGRARCGIPVSCRHCGGGCGHAVVPLRYVLSTPLS